MAIPSTDVVSEESDKSTPKLDSGSVGKIFPGQTNPGSFYILPMEVSEFGPNSMISLRTPPCMMSAIQACSSCVFWWRNVFLGHIKPPSQRWSEPADHIHCFVAAIHLCSNQYLQNGNVPCRQVAYHNRMLPRTRKWLSVASLPCIVRDIKLLEHF